MARFQQAVRTSNVTNAQAILEIIAGNRGCRVKAIYITLATAVTGVFGVGRPAAAGITPTTPTTFGPIDGVGDRSMTAIALAWGTSPTAPTLFFRRVSVPATIGAIRDTPVLDVYVPAGATLTLHNITGGPTLDVSIDIEE